MPDLSAEEYAGWTFKSVISALRLRTSLLPYSAVRGPPIREVAVVATANQLPRAVSHFPAREKIGSPYPESQSCGRRRRTGRAAGPTSLSPLLPFDPLRRRLIPASPRI